MSRHTPGPWTVYLSDIQDDRHAANVAYIECSPSDENRGEIAVIYGDADQVANARLIAAAPELLDALKRVRSEIPTAELNYSPLIEAIDSAIAKAEGR